MLGMSLVTGEALGIPLVAGALLGMLLVVGESRVTCRVTRGVDWEVVSAVGEASGREAAARRRACPGEGWGPGSRWCAASGAALTRSQARPLLRKE